jgi:CcmD family protein
MNIALEAGVAIYVALAVALSVWIGIFVYLWRLDAQTRELRRKLDSQPEQTHTAAPTATLHTQAPAAPDEEPGRGRHAQQQQTVKAEK